MFHLTMAENMDEEERIGSPSHFNTFGNLIIFC